MKWKTIALVVVALLSMADQTAQAGFLNNYGEWKAASPSVKLGFVMAYWDQATTIQKAEGAASEAEMAGIRSCAGAVSLTADMLVDAVNGVYARNLDWWDRPAVLVVMGVVQNICLQKINDERTSRGLAIWQKWAGF